MIVIDCNPLTIPLYLPECAGTGPFTATLARNGQETVELEATLDEETSRLTLAGVPADAKRGLWLLSVTTNCGCYTAMVFVDMCRAPRFVGTHIPTVGAPGPSTECCDPETTVGAVFVATSAPTEEPQALTVEGDITSATLSANGLTLTLVFSAAQNGTLTLIDSYGDTLATQPIVATPNAVIVLTTPLPCGRYALSVAP